MTAPFFENSQFEISQFKYSQRAKQRAKIAFNYVNYSYCLNLDAWELNFREKSKFQIAFLNVRRKIRKDLSAEDLCGVVDGSL
jgi:hypothetical protein